MIVNYALQTIELMQLHYSRLSAKERKRYAALEALKLGPGGVESISYILGIRKNTIRRAINEMIEESEKPSVPKVRKRKKRSSRKKNG